MTATWAQSPLPITQVSIRKPNTSTPEFIWYATMLSMAIFPSRTYAWTTSSPKSLQSLSILNDIPRISWTWVLSTMEGIENRQLTIVLRGECGLECDGGWYLSEVKDCRMLMAWGRQGGVLSNCVNGRQEVRDLQSKITMMSDEVIGRARDRSNRRYLRCACWWSDLLFPPRSSGSHHSFQTKCSTQRSRRRIRWRTWEWRRCGNCVDQDVNAAFRHVLMMKTRLFNSSAAHHDLSNVSKLKDKDSRIIYLPMHFITPLTNILHIKHCLSNSAFDRLWALLLNSTGLWQTLLKPTQNPVGHYHIGATGTAWYQQVVRKSGAPQWQVTAPSA